MLTIHIPKTELWDENQQIFLQSKEYTLQLEHSLVSISKWESRWQKPFLTKSPKTLDETVDYVRCMTVNKNVDQDAYAFLSNENINTINRYIDSPMSATCFSEHRTGPVNREQVTSELIYYWMVALNIPFECQKWHLNRLLTLIRICNIKNQPPKKRSRNEILSRNAAINAARRKQYNTSG